LPTEENQIKRYFSLENSLKKQMVRVIFELVASFTSNGELWNLSQFCELNPQCSIISTYPGSNPNASPLIGIFYPLKIEDLSKLKANLLI